jgi:hypothetical protein
MCSWITEKTGITAHGKGVSDWIPLTTATVYYDHPASAPLDHALIIDFLDEAAGPGARVAVELSAESARSLVRAIEAALAAGEECDQRNQIAAVHAHSPAGATNVHLATR